MKKVGAILVLGSILTIALFSFSFMAHEMSSGAPCFAERAMGAICPQEGALSASFHMGAFKKITLSFLGNQVMNGAMFFTLILLLFFAVTSLSDILKSIENDNKKLFIRDTYFSSQSDSLRSWLARHEQSPSIAFSV